MKRFVARRDPERSMINSIKRKRGEKREEDLEEYFDSHKKWTQSKQLELNVLLNLAVHRLLDGREHLPAPDLDVAQDRVVRRARLLQLDPQPRPAQVFAGGPDSEPSLVPGSVENFSKDQRFRERQREHGQFRGSGRRLAEVRDLDVDSTRGTIANVFAADLNIQENMNLNSK